MKKKRLLIIVSFILSVITVQADRSTIINRTRKPIHVAFTANGCFKIFQGWSKTCKGVKNVQPGQSVSYNWKRLHTGEKININASGKKYHINKTKHIQWPNSQWQQDSQNNFIQKIGQAFS